MMREVLHYSNGRISLLALARPGFYGLAGPVAGYIAARAGERRTAITGAAVVTLSCGAVALIGPGTVDAYIVACLALAGAGYGLLFPPLTAAITTAVDPQDLGMAGAASSVAMYVGMVTGIQLHQTIQESRERAAGILPSYHQAFLAGTVIALVGTLVVSQIRSLPCHTATTPEAALGRPRPTPASLSPRTS